MKIILKYDALFRSKETFHDVKHIKPLGVKGSYLLIFNSLNYIRVNKVLYYEVMENENLYDKLVESIEDNRAKPKMASWYTKIDASIKAEPIMLTKAGDVLLDAIQVSKQYREEVRIGFYPVSREEFNFNVAVNSRIEKEPIITEDYSINIHIKRKENTSNYYVHIEEATEQFKKNLRNADMLGLDLHISPKDITHTNTYLQYTFTRRATFTMIE